VLADGSSQLSVVQLGDEPWAAVGREQLCE
jgi:hypothetical protein